MHMYYRYKNIIFYRFVTVELPINNSEPTVQCTSTLTDVSASIISEMSPIDNNFNDSSEAMEEIPDRMNGAHSKLEDSDEENLNNNAIGTPDFQKLYKLVDTVIEVTRGHNYSKSTSESDDDDKIKEYLQRSDTAVIYPEPVGRSDNGKLYKIYVDYLQFSFFFITI